MAGIHLYPLFSFLSSFWHVFVIWLPNLIQIFNSALSTPMSSVPQQLTATPSTPPSTQLMAAHSIGLATSSSRKSTRFRDACPDVSNRGSSTKKGKNTCATCIHHIDKRKRERRCARSLGKNRISAYNAFRALVEAEPFSETFRGRMRYYVALSSCWDHRKDEKDYVECIIGDLTSDILEMYLEEVRMCPSYTFCARHAPSPGRQSTAPSTNGLGERRMGHTLVGSAIFSCPGAFPVVDSDSENLISQFHETFKRRLEAFPEHVDESNRHNFARILPRPESPESEPSSESEGYLQLPKDHPDAFEIFNKQTKPIHLIAEEALGPKADRDGYIYVYEQPEGKDYLKIGYTTGSVSNRLEEWDVQCGGIPTLVHVSRKICHVSRVEQLIHAELQSRGNRHFKTTCKSNPGRKCKRLHREWFKISQGEARKVVDYWTEWMAYFQPYGPDGLLKSSLAGYFSLVLDELKSHNGEKSENFEDALEVPRRFFCMSNGVSWKNEDCLCRPSLGSVNATPEVDSPASEDLFTREEQEDLAETPSKPPRSVLPYRNSNRPHDTRAGRGDSRKRLSKQRQHIDAAAASRSKISKTFVKKPPKVTEIKLHDSISRLADFTNSAASTQLTFYKPDGEWFISHEAQAVIPAMALVASDVLLATSTAAAAVAQVATVSERDDTLTTQPVKVKS